MEAQQRPGRQARIAEEVGPVHRQDQAKVGPAEHRHEMRRGKGQDEVIGQVAHRAGHHLHQVAVVADQFPPRAIGPARQQEEQEEAGHQALVEGRQPRFGSGSSSISGVPGPNAKNSHRAQTPARPGPAWLQALALASAVSGRRRLFAAPGHCPAPAGSQVPSRGSMMRSVTYQITGRNRKNMRGDEIPVAGDVGGEGAEHRFHRRLGDAEQQRIELAGQQVGRKAARNAREAGGDAGDRMAPGGVHGWIILDKPLGLGSTQAVGAVKRVLREAGYGKVKVGHGGTLDPLADRRAADRAGRGDQAGRADARCQQDLRLHGPPSARRPTRSTRRRGRRDQRCAPQRWPIEAVLPRFTGRSSRCRRPIPRSRSMASAPMTWRGRARRWS
jgi:hypothetical protein